MSAPISSELGDSLLGSLALGTIDESIPTAAVMVGGISPVLRYCVIDPVTGAVLIDDLPHLHQSSWDMVGFQPGATGRSAIGSFVIRLFPPGSDGYKNAKQFYDLLSYGLRIEGYLGDIIAGDPKFTGFIKSIVKSFTEYTISGDDALALLQAARTDRSEVFSGRTDQLVSYAMNAYDLAVGDDFSLGFGNFTNDGGWTATTDGGKAAIQPGVTGDGLLYTTHNFTNAEYADCSIEIPFRLVCAATPGATAEAAIVASASDANNLVLGQLILTCRSASRFELNFNIYQKAGGVYTRLAVTQPLAIPGNVLPGHLQLKGYQASPTTYLWRLIINGSDQGCFWVQTVAAGSPTGYAGLRSAKTGSSVNEAMYVAAAPTGFAFWSKVAWFRPGRISTGTQSLNQAIPDTPNMDLLQLAATTEAGEYRKNPKAGLNQDTIDFGQTVGTDFSAMIRFEEGLNVTDASIEPNAEDFGVHVQSSAPPSLGGSGWVRFPNIALVKAKGNRLVYNPAARISDILAHRLYAQQINSLSGNPGQAKRVTVKRDEWADRVRELDVIELHLPSFGIYHARAKVVGYTFKEGAGTTVFMLDQYPRTLDRVPKFDRLLANVDSLMTRTQEVTAIDTANPSQFLRDARPVLPSNPWKMRVSAAGGQSFADNVGGPVRVQWANVQYDTSGGWDVVNNQWRVPLSGWYDIKVAIQLSPPGNGPFQYQWYSLLSRVGDVNAVSEGPVGYSSAQPAAGIGPLLVDTAYLNAGDLVYVQVAAQSGAGAGNWFISGTSPPAAYLTFWTMQFSNG